MEGADGTRGQLLRFGALGGVNTAITEQFPMTEDFELSLFARIMPFKDMGEPENLAAAFAYLASDDASYVNGVILPSDGGWSAA